MKTIRSGSSFRSFESELEKNLSPVFNCKLKAKHIETKYFCSTTTNVIFFFEEERQNRHCTSQRLRALRKLPRAHLFQERGTNFLVYGGERKYPQAPGVSPLCRLHRFIERCCDRSFLARQGK